MLVESTHFVVKTFQICFGDGDTDDISSFRDINRGQSCLAHFIPLIMGANET